MTHAPTLSIVLLGVLAAAAHGFPNESPDPEPSVTGPTNAAFAPLDELMTGFVRERAIPGAALAVARHGRLIYARGFGLADRETGEPVQPDSLFRIASLSKPVTAVAVLSLVERGALGLDDRVFDILELEARIPEGAALDPRWRFVTIRHLLQHTGGWDRDVSFDPMFRAVEFARRAGVDPPAGPWEVIRGMLGEPLDFDPGTRYAYSNFGYCLLGRVIERVSGRDYEGFVRDEVLAPRGIRSMRLGRTRLDERAPGEVRYVTPNEATGPSVFAADLGKPVPQPYGCWNLEAMDAHGGWIASAVDLVRFASALGKDNGSTPRLLEPKTVDLMFAPPDGATGFEADGSPKVFYYGCGWNVRRVGEGRINTWHTGSLPGTSTLLVRRHDGFVWAVLFNGRYDGPNLNLVAAIDPRIHEAVDRLPAWPDSLFTPSEGDPDPLADLAAFQDRLREWAIPPEPIDVDGGR